MIRVLFVIRSLVNHGAERQLVELVKGMDKSEFQVTVVTLYEGGVLGPELEGLPGIELFSLQKRSRWDVLRPTLRLWALVRRTRPHILHGYMGPSNELCSVVGKLAGTRVVWGIRTSEGASTEDQHRRISRMMQRIDRLLAPSVDLVIVNSSAGKRLFVDREYSARRLAVVPNGIDIERFRPDVEGGRRLRHQWGVEAGHRLIGMVARLDPVKGHDLLLQAVAPILRERGNVRIVFVGGGPPAFEDELRSRALELGIGPELIWAGTRGDLAAVYSALDVAVSASTREGFSNSIAEAMACGVPCVVTDVGDSAQIVGEERWVVPRSDRVALQGALLEMLDLTDGERCRLSSDARARIEDEYSSRRLVKTTESLLREL